LKGLIKGVPVMLLACLMSHAQVDILTANGGNGRTNANLQEVNLTPATVSAGNFGKLATFPVDGQVYSQPLYVSALSIPGRGTYNVLFVTTMHNTVYAFDADSAPAGRVLWQVNLGPSVPSTLLFGMYGDVSIEVGILSTGAIDRVRGVLYVVTDILRNGVPVFSLHALDLATGAERLNGPVVLNASVAGTGSGGTAGRIPFNPKQHIQRPGLLLANGSVYVAFGSHGDQSPYHGWLMSYDASDLTHQNGVYVSTPNGDEGAFWQSGRGPAVDELGNIYAVTGNGDFDGVQNFGQSFLKLSGTVPAVVASFTPDDWKSMSDNDFDLSGGPALIGGTHNLVGADKGGNLYVLNGDLKGRQPAPRTSASTNAIFNFAIWSRPGNSLIFVQAAQTPPQAFQVTAAGLNPNPVSVAAAPVQFSRIGMTISANGTKDGTGILWETTGNYNTNLPGTLHAFDASDLSVELWNSDMIGSRDAMPAVAKFASPTVVNGKVYVPTFGNAVMVYGLLQGGLTSNVPQISTVANAASFSQDAISPGALISIFGTNIGPVAPAGLQLDNSGLVASDLSDTQVLFDGVPAPLLYTSATQVNAVVPFGLSVQSTQVQILFNGQTSDPVAMPVVPATPGIFSQDSSGTGPGIIVNQDGSLNSAAAPAAAGTIVTLYATGAGQLNPPGQDGAVVTADSLPLPVLPVTAQVGGQAAQIFYAGGAPGIVQGVIQVNLQIPATAPSGPSVPIVLNVGGQGSQQGLTIAIQ
jgi:uncharacterized protein (TIGR03437 family)